MPRSGRECDHTEYNLFKLCKNTELGILEWSSDLRSVVPGLDQARLRGTGPRWVQALRDDPWLCP